MGPTRLSVLTYSYFISLELAFLCVLKELPFVICVAVAVVSTQIESEAVDVSKPKRSTSFASTARRTASPLDSSLNEDM
eukprot:4968512-Amphidinium_carterae.1